MPDPIEALRMIAADMESDAREFDGQPFTGATVAEYMGNQGAAIAAIANILALHLSQDSSRDVWLSPGEPFPLEVDRENVQRDSAFIRTHPDGSREFRYSELQRYPNGRLIVSGGRVVVVPRAIPLDPTGRTGDVV